MSRQLPIHEGLFTWPAERPQLLGSRCPQCGEHAFPAQRDCRNCGCDSCETVPIGDRGMLWTWTVQSFMPKPPYRSAETEASFAETLTGGPEHQWLPLWNLLRQYMPGRLSERVVRIRRESVDYVPLSDPEERAQRRHVRGSGAVWRPE